MSISETKPALGAVALQFRSSGPSSDGGERYTASEKQTGRNYAVSKAGGQDPASETWLVLGGKSGELGKTANKAAAFMVAENDARIAVQQMVRAMRMAEAAKEQEALAEERRAEIEAEQDAERRAAEETAKQWEEEAAPVEPEEETPVTEDPSSDETPVGETPQDPSPSEEDEEQPEAGGESGGEGDEDSGSGSDQSGTGGIVDILV